MKEWQQLVRKVMFTLLTLNVVTLTPCLEMTKVECLFSELESVDNSV
jgi:hypothetical protein